MAELLTIAEAAAALKVSKATIYRFCAAGMLRHEKYTARTIRISAEAIAEFRQRQSRGPEALKPAAVVPVPYRMKALKI